MSIYTMASETPNGKSTTGSTTSVRYLSLTFDDENRDASALELVTMLLPDWKSPDSNIHLIRLTQGITNTLIKVVNKREGLSEEQIDKEAILLRAYGRGTHVLIDRQRETQNHELLSLHGLAPELLARFKNGMIYRFIRGKVTAPDDLSNRNIYLAVARRLAEWHATVPCISETLAEKIGNLDKSVLGHVPQAATDHVAPGKPPPNVWTVMQRWILALPHEKEEDDKRRAELQGEFVWLVEQLSQQPSLGKNGLVFAHCDLLCGNIIVKPKKDSVPEDEESVMFIDYEYATPSPAAFDLANHFSEWGGFDCDYNKLPTRSQRREFIKEYIKTYFQLLPDDVRPANVDLAQEEAKLFNQVDAFRGAPGLYWGIWALIQATISQIEFDYASYAETRLAEYWAWKAEDIGQVGQELPLREKKWKTEN